MTTWTFKGNPPYPVNPKDEFLQMGACRLVIEDKNKKIDFINNDSLFFEINYKPNGSCSGSLKEYAKTIKDQDVNILRMVVEYNLSFTLIIKSYNDDDLTGLTAKFEKIKTNPYSNRMFAQGEF